MGNDRFPTGASHWTEYDRELLTLCQAKAEELHLLGYEDVQATDVRACVLAQTKGQTALHELVAAIIGLNAGQFMNFTTMNAYRGIFANDAEQRGAPFDAGKRA